MITLSFCNQHRVAFQFQAQATLAQLQNVSIYNTRRREMVISPYVIQ